MQENNWKILIIFVSADFSQKMEQKCTHPPPPPKNQFELHDDFSTAFWNRLSSALSKHLISSNHTNFPQIEKEIRLPQSYVPEKNKKMGIFLRFSSSALTKFKQSVEENPSSQFQVFILVEDRTKWAFKIFPINNQNKTTKIILAHRKVYLTTAS